MIEVSILDEILKDDSISLEDKLNKLNKYVDDNRPKTDKEVNLVKLYINNIKEDDAFNKSISDIREKLNDPNITKDEVKDLTNLIKGISYEQKLKRELLYVMQFPKSYWQYHFKTAIVDMVTSGEDNMTWYGQFLTRFGQEIDVTMQSPCAVYYNMSTDDKKASEGYTLIINPAILSLVSRQEQIAILKHEVSHVMNQHFFRFTAEKGYPNHKLNNIATDIAINGSVNKPIIANLPGSRGYEDSLLAGMFSDYFQKYVDAGVISDYKEEMHAEYYLDLLKKCGVEKEMDQNQQNQNEQSQNQQGNSQNQGITQEDVDQAKELLDKLVENKKKSSQENQNTKEQQPTQEDLDKLKETIDKMKNDKDSQEQDNQEQEQEQDNQDQGDCQNGSCESNQPGDSQGQDGQEQGDSQGQEQGDGQGQEGQEQGDSQGQEGQEQGDCQNGSCQSGNNQNGNITENSIEKLKQDIENAKNGKSSDLENDLNSKLDDISKDLAEGEAKSDKERYDRDLANSKNGSRGIEQPKSVEEILEQKRIEAEYNKLLGDLAREMADSILKGKYLEHDIDDHSIQEKNRPEGISNEAFERIALKDLQQMVNQTTKQNGRGFQPMEIDKCMLEIDKALRVQVRWDKVLRKSLGRVLSKVKVESSSRVNHLLYPKDPNTNGYVKGKEPQVHVIMDVSGSMTNKEIIMGVNEVKSIAKRYGGIPVKLIQVDTVVHEVTNVNESLKGINRAGAGGTYMEPGFEYIYDKKNRLGNPEVIVIVTDGGVEQDFSQFKLPKGVKVVWLATQGLEHLNFDIDKYPQMSAIHLDLNAMEKGSKKISRATADIGI
jgi:predicted metal-dependent peptidase